MRVCLFGTYNRDHSANRIYAAAARAAGHEVIEVHEPLWEKTRDKGASYFAPLRLLVLGGRWLVAGFRLARRWRALGGAPVAIVGFNGQLDVFLLRLLAGRYGPRIVFAPLVSITETLVDDRGVYRAGSAAAWLLSRIDRLACRTADVVVADTQAHREYFIERLGVDGARVAVCYLGVDNEMFSPGAQSRVASEESQETAQSSSDPGVGRGGSTLATPMPGPAVRARKREILYFGQYLPLHGLDVVVDAVKRLASREDLRFTFIGTGEERARVEQAVLSTPADVEFISWIAYEALAARIARADVVLGIFGSSQKARMVVPNKVYEAAAVGCPVITADTPAIREVFCDGRDILLRDADGAALADAITALSDDEGLRTRLGESAASTMAERFSDEALGRAWSRILDPNSATDATPVVGVAILNFNDSEATLRCLGSLAHVQYKNLRILVVDNGSRPDQRSVLEEQMAGRFHASVRWLNENLGYAGANNIAVGELFDQGCRYVLVLNNDTIVTPDAVDALLRCARRHPGGGPVGPRVARDWPGAPAASLGERYWAPLLWAPRSIVRHRRARQRCYPVRGVMGCAMLVSRSLWDRLGGFDESLFAYYEEVDLCLRARAAGMTPRVEPSAEIAHRGHRGFGAGFTPTAAYLKARNLWLLGRRRLRLPGLLLFAPGYFALIGASIFVYRLRGRRGVARAIREGAAAGLRGQDGAPPQWVFEVKPPTRSDQEPARG